MTSPTPRGPRSARRLLLAGAAALVAGIVPATANADELFTLDGQPSTQAAIVAAGAICGAAPNDSGVNECFSTYELLATAQAAAVRAGELPPGWGVIPATQPEREALAQAFDADAGGSASKGVSLLAFDACKASTQVATGTSGGGTVGTQGQTGTNVWQNYSSTYSNQISSFRTTNQAWDTRWHDLQDGAGAYYGPIGTCVTDNDLSNNTMNDGGTANDRFSSFAGW
ncbi:hypothetical protein [Patulibacter defluvii]|uniref:hypothetical protein n=1 Tax=Patulibacter defluvii TaxID=3095358 RepID=UPI002A76570A|nr:hypothetical protein [Patulibacter sp. DM4]